MSIRVVAVGVALGKPHTHKCDSGREHVRERVDGIGYHCGGITENACEQLKGCKKYISAHSDSGDLPGYFLPIRNAAVLARLRAFVIPGVGFGVVCHGSNSLGREQCLLATRNRVRKNKTRLRNGNCPAGAPKGASAADVPAGPAPWRYTTA